jgi:hypothetical protein
MQLPRRRGVGPDPVAKWRIPGPDPVAKKAGPRTGSRFPAAKREQRESDNWGHFYTKFFFLILFILKNYYYYYF